MDQRAREIVEIGDSLFGARSSLMTYWQELAANFYPERADFLTRRDETDFWSGMMTSEPVLIRRELSNLIQSFLRPASNDWYDIHVADVELDKEREVRVWLEYMTGIQRRAMFDPVSKFARMTKMSDNDWVTFGMCVNMVDVSRDRTHLVYRNDHIRDHAWSENEEGNIDTNHCKWKPSVRQLKRIFPKTFPKQLEQMLQQEPNRLVNCRRFIVPRDTYDLDRSKFKANRSAPFVSVYLDEENQTVLEEYPIMWNPFVIPRWQMVSGSPYGWSPCTGPGLADARTLQTVVRVLLEAGEKAVDPPLIATSEVVRSDINVYAGGVTWVDELYDERLGEALRPLSQDRSGIPLGMEFADRFRNVLSEGHFLNKLTLPQELGGEKRTAYEVRKLLEEHMRSAVPLLSPAEDEYNSPLCERTFEVLSAMRAFGPAENIPEVLRKQPIRYEFRSPIKEMANEIKGQKLMEALEIQGASAKFDPAQMKQLDLDVATRDALRGINIPATWLSKDGTVQKFRKEQEEAAQRAAEAEAAMGAGQIAEQMGKGGQALQQMGAPPNGQRAAA